MSAQSLLIRCCCASVLSTIAVTALAETPARKTLSVRITPKLIQESAAAAAAIQPSIDQSQRLDREFQQHNLFRPSPQNLDDMPNACSRKGGPLCFDYRSGRSVYKPMRKLLPEIPGMTPHNLSIRRNKVVAHYTFK